MTTPQGVSKAQIREALAAGPDTACYSFDGFGFNHIGSGSSSDWLTSKPDAEPLWAIAAESLSNLLAQPDAKDAETKRVRASIPSAVDYLQGEPDYHDQGMGCGLEDRNILTDMTP